MKLWKLVFFAALLFVAGCITNGCAAMHNRVLVSTGTVIGVEIGENPATGLYNAKLGYDRAEIALVPVTNGYTPDVITEIRYSGIFSTSGGIYQRMAVGPNAVTQPGAQALFLKDPNGQLGTNAYGLLKSVPAVKPEVQSSLAKVAVSFGSSTNKVAWDTVAQSNGYTSFSSVLTDTKLAPETLLKIVADLQAAKLLLK